MQTGQLTVCPHGTQQRARNLGPALGAKLLMETYSMPLEHALDVIDCRADLVEHDDFRIYVVWRI